MTTHQVTASTALCPIGAPVSSPRMVSMAGVNGWYSANWRTPTGIDEAGANALPMKGRNTISIYPDQVPAWAAQKRTLFEDPAFQRLYLTIDTAAAWDRDDPRLESIADEVNAVGGLQNPDPSGEAEQILAPDALVAVTLMAAQSGKPVPALERLVELCRARRAGTSDG